MQSSSKKVTGTWSCSGIFSVRGGSQLFAKTILHCPLQSVTITQVAGPPEIFTGFSCLLHLEINQTPIQVGL